METIKRVHIHIVSANPHIAVQFLPVHIRIYAPFALKILLRAVYGGRKEF